MLTTNTNTITTTGTPTITTGTIKATSIPSESWYSQFDLKKMLVNTIDPNIMLFNTNLSLPSKDIV